MENTMNEGVMVELHEAFKLFDKDGNGSITIDELAPVVRCFCKNPSVEELQDMIKEVDSDGNGAIEFPEFTSLFMENDVDEHDLREAFNVFDKDQNGFISAYELRQVMNCLGDHSTDEEIIHMIDEADLDGDGMVSYEEFVKMMMAIGQLINTHTHSM